MDNSELVTIAYNKHHHWLMACCFNFTQSQGEAEDLLQDVILHLLQMKDLHKIIYESSDLNMFYVYKIIKSKFLNNEKAKKKLEVSELNEDIFENAHSEEYNIEGDEMAEKLLQIVDQTLNNELHWFDQKLFKTYVDEEHSIQSLHEATKISRNTIFNSLKKTKDYIKQKALNENLHS